MDDSLLVSGGSTLEGYVGLYQSEEIVHKSHDRDPQQYQRRPKQPRRSQQKDLIRFPNPHADLRERKVLLSRALGDDTAKRGSAAHVLVGSGDLGLVQSFMKLRAGGRHARAMIGDGLIGRRVGNVNKAMQTYKEKAGWQ